MPRFEGWARKRAAVIASWRPANWPLIILVVGFVTIPLSTGVLGLYLIDPFTAYKRAVVAAALKQPGYRRTLTALDENAKTVTVVNFREPLELPLEKRNFDMWVALIGEARTACAGSGNPVRKLQQAFGLPPRSAKTRVVTVLEVPRDALIRPCIGSYSGSGSHCEFDGPKPLAADADEATIRKEYERLRLVTAQMWASYRTDFRISKLADASDYPYEGFPFTGMGWSYNWSNKSPNHFGVSEFVIKRDAAIKIVSEKTPAEFCRGK